MIIKHLRDKSILFIVNNNSYISYFDDNVIGSYTEDGTYELKFMVNPCELILFKNNNTYLIWGLK